METIERNSIRLGTITPELVEFSHGNEDGISIAILQSGCVARYVLDKDRLEILENANAMIFVHNHITDPKLGLG